MDQPQSPPPRVENGAIHLFRVSGIDVFLHWSWLIVGYIEMSSRADEYQHYFYSIAEYLSLFLIVLLHEFGHALACRSVGGQANRILLWPLGGVAYVQPPRRPGAVLWSICAGPLVNLLLMGPLLAAVFLLDSPTVTLNADQKHFLETIAIINAVLFVFNMLPIYPLDGGQILQCLLWYVVGFVRSLKIAAGIGLAAAGVAVVWAVTRGDIWLIVLAAFAGMRSLAGLQEARLMRQHGVDA